MTWIDEENGRIKDEEKKRREELGFKEPVLLEEGLTVIVIDTADKPSRIETEYGERYVLTLIEPPDKNLISGKYLYTMVLAELAKNNGNGHIQIVRTGTGKQTRYAVSTAKGI